MCINRKLIIFFTGSIILFYFISCSTKNTYKTLTFFFDGVPDMEQKITPQDSTSNNVSEDTLIAVKMKGSYHEPFAAKQCEKCHKPSNRSQLIESQPSLCNNCHNDFTEIYEESHGPVSGGMCTSCHHPHKANLRKLLHKDKLDLCYHCHDSKSIINSEIHKDLNIEDCTECHNPHGGNNTYFIEPNACYKCHEDFNNKYDFVHGPVNGSHCSKCHTPHSEKKEKLLSRKDNELCTVCHSSPLHYQSEVHKNNALCVSCHNPHGGNNRFFTYLK